jgi:hypothetical protein
MKTKSNLILKNNKKSKMNQFTKSLISFLFRKQNKIEASKKEEQWSEQNEINQVIEKLSFMDLLTNKNNSVNLNLQNLEYPDKNIIRNNEDDEKLNKYFQKIIDDFKNINNKENIKNLHFLFILDESGSMSVVREKVCFGLKYLIEECFVQSNINTHIDHYISIVSFDGSEKIRLNTILWIKKLSFINMKELKINYNPHGSTPLYDAIGITCTKLDSKISNPENTAVIAFIITDGRENASMMYNLLQIKDLIDRLIQKNWKFIFIGTRDLFKQANDIGINNFIEFSHDNIQQAFKNMSFIIRRVSDNFI